MRKELDENETGLSQMIEATPRVADIFAPDNEHSARQRATGLKKTRAEHRLVIHFTPRSGSSWLSSLLEASGYLGIGLELFNPQFIPNIARHMGARSLSEYIELAHYHPSRKGTLSFEITSHQLRAVFKKPDAFFDVFSNSFSFWLVREDIVAQAVSLAKMVRFNIGHATSSDAETRTQAESDFNYDGAEIERWLKHILVAERNTEALLQAHSVSPLRLSYEQITAISPIRLLAVIAAWAGLPPPDPNLDIKTGHEKIGTSKNQDFAERFRHEKAAFLEEVDAERRAWLSQLRSMSEFSEEN